MVGTGHHDDMTVTIGSLAAREATLKVSRAAAPAAMVMPLADGATRAPTRTS